MSCSHALSCLELSWLLHFQHDPRDNLDLSSHACRSVDVSLAVVNEQGPSEFSEALALDVYGGKREWIVDQANGPA